jgi:hypothetical protein
MTTCVYRLKTTTFLPRYVLMSLCGRGIFVLWSAFSHELAVLFLYRQIGFRILYYFFLRFEYASFLSHEELHGGHVRPNSAFVHCVNRLIITIYTL